MNYVWPLALIILSNVMYQVCTKSVPNEMNPFASLTVTYIIGAVVAFLLYLTFEKMQLISQSVITF